MPTPGRLVHRFRPGGSERSPPAPGLLCWFLRGAFHINRRAAACLGTLVFRVTFGAVFVFSGFAELGFSRAAPGRPASAFFAAFAAFRAELFCNRPNLPASLSKSGQSG